MKKMFLKKKIMQFVGKWTVEKILFLVPKENYRHFLFIFCFISFQWDLEMGFAVVVYKEENEKINMT